MKITTDSEHREQAREPERIKVFIRAGKDDWIGIAYSTTAGDPDAIHEYVSARAFSSRNAEICEVLEGLAISVPRYGLCWCAATSDPHEPECLAACALYKKAGSSL